MKGLRFPHALIHRTQLLFLICLWISVPAPWVVASPSSDSLPASDSLSVGIPSTPLSLDPTNYRDRDTQMVLKNIYDSLTTRDKHLLVTPQLAESWHSVDPTTWEFKLRENIRFHNGDPLTSDDVRFTLERVTREGGIDGVTSPRRSLFGSITTIETPSPLTVRIITAKPNPILPLLLTLQEIVPKKYMEQVGSRGFEKAPVGAGPFKFVEQRRDTLILERFEGYYGGSRENPPVQIAPLKQLVFHIVPDQVMRIAMLKKGRLDLITNIPFETAPLFNMLPDVSIMSQPASRSYFADLNCAKFPFNDPRARLAVNYAMDMRRIIDTLYQGHAQILPTILLPQSFSYNERLLPYPYDPEAANELFSRMNLPKDTVIRIVSIEKYAKFANTISLFLSKVGLHSEVEIGEKEEMRAAMKNLKADILVTSWGNTTLDPVDILIPKLQSSGYGNFSSYSNPEVDRLIDQAENALDPARRSATYKKVQEIVYKDAPMIFGYAAEEFYGVRKRVKGFSPSATGMLNLHDVYVEP